MHTAKPDRIPSHRGYVFMLGNAAISWSSKKQTLVALSTKEAEYTASTEASREALWLRQHLLDIDSRGGSHPEIQGATIIHADNQGAIKHASSEGVAARTKHFDISLRHARDLQQKGIVRFTYIRSAENTADIFTKGLPLTDHRRHIENLGLSTGT